MLYCRGEFALALEQPTEVGAGGRILRIERQGPAIVADGRGQIAGDAGEVGQTPVISRVEGGEFAGAREGGTRPGQVSCRFEDEAEVRVGLGVVRVDCDGPAVESFGALSVARLEIQIPQPLK